MDELAVKQRIWKTVQAMNGLWAIDGRADELTEYFHERMSAITPGDRLRLFGRDACVAGWKAFSDAAKVHYWKEIDPQIELFGDGTFAVVTYYFDMSYDMGGQTVIMGGRDMMSLVNEDGRWWVVSDQFSPYPSS